METTPSSLESGRPLVVYLDFKSPYAWLALHPTMALAKDLGMQVDWRPFVLDIPSYLGSAKLDRAGKVKQQQRSAEQWSGVKYAYYDCRRYANLRRMTVRGTVKIWDTNLAAIGMLWAKQQGDTILEAYMNAVFDPFWKRELDPEDIAVIRTLLLQVGAEIDGFDDYAAGPGAAENQALQTAAFDAGIFGVPTYVVNGHKYFGREHLPRIRWHLSGEHGPAPDIAYEPGSRRATDSASEHRLEVCIDFSNANSFLALGPTLALAAELNREVDWHPLVSQVRTAKPAPDGESRGARHFRFRAEYRTRDTLRYASGMLPTEDGAMDSHAAGMGLLWLKQHSPAHLERYVSQVFENTWQHGLPTDTIATVETLLQHMGLDSTGFAEYAAASGQSALQEVQHALAARGVIGSPTYLLGDEPFLGRQHLPLIRTRLLGSAAKG